MASTRSGLSQVQQVRKHSLWLAAVPCAIAFLVVAPLWREGSLGEESIEMLGLGLIALAVAGRTWCTLYIGGRKKREIVSVGPYSLSRNPLYVFSVLGALGIGMTSGSIAVGLLVAAFAFVIFDGVVRREEAYLESHFGDTYAAYRRRVPRWLLPQGHWRDAEHLDVRPKLVLITFRDASIMLLALPVVEGVEALRGLLHLPVLLHLP